LARQAKDMAAGAVLIATICSIFSGLCLFGPPLWAVIFGT